MFLLAVDALSAQETVQQLFTWESLATLGGSVLATVIVTNSIASIAGAAYTKLMRRLTALALAMACQLGAAAFAAGGGQKWIVAILNGFLVYTSALGLNQQAVGVTSTTLPDTGVFRRWL
jgi:hypothetical protein